MNITLNSNSRNQNFGMAVKLDESAHAIIKRQASKLGDKSYEKFWNKFDDTVKRQEGNPVDIIIRKCKHRKALAAEVVDHGEAPMDNTIFHQSKIFPSGLKFLDKAEKKADKINNLNYQIAKYQTAAPEDFQNGAKSVDIEA